MFLTKINNQSKYVLYSPCNSKLNSMSETLDNVNTQPGTRPVFLTVICILSFVGIGLAIIGYVGAFALLGVAEVATSGTTAVTTTAGATVTTVSTGIIWAYIIGGFITVILQLVGVLQMWKLRKSGFYLYTVATVIALVLGFLYGASVFSLILPIAFIIMYGVNLKAMR